MIRLLVTLACTVFSLLLVYYHLHPMVPDRKMADMEELAIPQTSEHLSFPVEVHTRISTEQLFGDKEIEPKSDRISLKNIVRERNEYLDLPQKSIREVSKEAQTTNYLASTISTDSLAIRGSPTFVSKNSLSYPPMLGKELSHVDPVVRTRLYIQQGITP